MDKVQEQDLQEEEVQDEELEEGEVRSPSKKKKKRKKSKSKGQKAVPGSQSQPQGQGSPFDHAIWNEIASLKNHVVRKVPDRGAKTRMIKLPVEPPRIVVTDSVLQKVEDLSIIDVSKDIWDKKICIKQSSEQLIVPSYFFDRKWPRWVALEMLDQKRMLNYVKNLLDDLPLTEWHEHTRRMNTAGLVVPRVRDRVYPEYGSQAWCKFYECLKSFPVIPLKWTSEGGGMKYRPTLMSVHLCEAPGAFISALNHFIHTNHPSIKWEWLATTLNPYHEGNDVGIMINEDKLITSSLDKWLFLEDTTGNIMNRTNFRRMIGEIKNRCSESGASIGLVTADGSVDCQNDPTDQENIVYSLQYAEIIAALSILVPGGTFVLKIFTFFECHTINNLYLLCSLFEEVHLFKPATSKEGNSEVYVVCLRYKGHFQRQLNFLTDQIGAENPLSKKFSMISFHHLLKSDFLPRIYRAAKFFSGYQMSIIKRNLISFKDVENRKWTYMQFEVMRQCIADDWFSRYRVVPLQKLHNLFNLKNSGPRQLTHLDPRSEVGTFRDKLKLLQTQNLSVKINEIEKQMKTYARYFTKFWHITHFVPDKTFEKICPVYGAPYKNIMSSRFCFGKLLNLREDIRTAITSVSKFSSLYTNKCISCDPDGKNLTELYKEVLGINGNSTWEVITVCCKNSLYDLANNSDMLLTKKIFREVLFGFSNLKEGCSLFLCSFPLLSRLQLGFLYEMSLYFETTLICSGTRGPEKNPPKGILLHRYKGVVSAQKQSMLLQLVTIVQEIGNGEAATAKQGKTILELVPVPKLLELECFNDILKYNLIVTGFEVFQMMTFGQWLA